MDVSPITPTASAAGLPRKMTPCLRIEPRRLTHVCPPAKSISFKMIANQFAPAVMPCPRIDSWIGEEAWAYLNMYYVSNRAASLLAAFQKAQTALLRELKRNHSVPEGRVSLSVIPSSSYL